MNKYIITISRQCGSGGHTIGKLIADKLDIPLYDKKILEMVSQRSGFSEETIQQQGEYKHTSPLYDIAMNLSYGNKYEPAQDQIYTFQSNIIRELSEKESCIIIGRCADYILRERADCFHVFIYGNIAEREKRATIEYHVPEHEAKSYIKSRDKKRREHYSRYTERTWGMVENYNLCLDSSYFGIDNCVELIVNHIQNRG